MGLGLDGDTPRVLASLGFSLALWITDFCLRFSDFGFRFFGFRHLGVGGGPFASFFQVEPKYIYYD